MKTLTLLTLLFLASCARPSTFTNESGTYYHLQNRDYHKEGDTVYFWGQRVYQFTKSGKPIKGEVVPAKANQYVTK